MSRYRKPPKEAPNVIHPIYDVEQSKNEISYVKLAEVICCVKEQLQSVFADERLSDEDIDQNIEDIVREGIVDASYENQAIILSFDTLFTEAVRRLQCVLHHTSPVSALEEKKEKKSVTFPRFRGPYMHLPA